MGPSWESALFLYNSLVHLKAHCKCVNMFRTLHFMDVAWSCIVMCIVACILHHVRLHYSFMMLRPSLTQLLCNKNVYIIICVVYVYVSFPFESFHLLVCCILFGGGGGGASVQTTASLCNKYVTFSK
jgi:hypothetical protein